MDFTAALIAENAAFAGLIRDADLSTPVPTCPDWTLDQLMRHVGRGDRWCAQIIAARSTKPIDPREVAGGKPPVERADAIEWLHDGARMLIDAVDSSGTQTPVWTFLGPRPAEWWIRRRLHETAVHRADAALALGVDFVIEPLTAADAITEYLERVVIRTAEAVASGAAAPLDAGESVHLHATDVDDACGGGEWTISGETDGIAVDRGHGKASVALRGPVRDILLALVRRGEADELGLEVFGQLGVWDAWLNRTPF